MEPYATSRETKIGINRPRIQHLAETGEERRTRSERQAEKASVAAERRAIKKGARQQLHREMMDDLRVTD